MTQFILKIIAAATMLIDHTGMILFPECTALRIIGRLAFPIYAYCIAEGFLYTRSLAKYFIRLLALGIICQIIFRSQTVSVLLTFSVSIIIMYLADCTKKALDGRKSSLAVLLEKLTHRELPAKSELAISLSLLSAAVVAAFVLCMYVRLDYGFFGVMLPVFTSRFPDRTRRFFMFTAALSALCIYTAYAGATLQLFALFAIPVIALYNGRCGKYKLKYFFYIFYPAHLAILYVISHIISKLN